MQLLVHQPERSTVFPWLRTVAQNEAIRLDGMAKRLLAYEEERAGTQFSQMAPNRGDVDERQGMIELRERLAQLPERQREVLFLHAAGWRYADIGEHLGISKTRVDQLMSRACALMREIDMRAFEVTSDRAGKLRSIEELPPTYIIASIGKPPPANPKYGGAEMKREWKRMVLAIEDYRETHSVTHQALPLGPATDNPGQASLRRRIADFREMRGLSQGIEL